MFGKSVWSSDLRAPGRHRPRLVMKPDDFFSGCSSLWRAVGVGSAEARCALCLGRRGGQGLAPPRLLPLAVPSTPPGSLHHPIDPNTTPPRTHTFNPQGELSSAPFRKIIQPLQFPTVPYFFSTRNCCVDCKSALDFQIPIGLVKELLFFAFLATIPSNCVQEQEKHVFLLL